jgi:hypothetical protein
MKKIFYLFNVAILLLALSSTKAQTAFYGSEFEKKKSITQSYDLSSSDRVSLSNKFGNIKVNTWAENKIKVDIEISVNARTEAKAQKVIDGITVKFNKANGVVSFKTNIDGMGSNCIGCNEKTISNTTSKTTTTTTENGKTSTHVDDDSDDNDDEGNGAEVGSKSKKGKTSFNNQAMEVNYVVYLPAKATLKLYNEFGNIKMPNYEGALEVHNKFGNFTAENLTNETNEVFVEFGDANIKSLTKPDLTVKFGNCDLANAIGNGEMKFDFCGDVNLMIDKNIGDVKIKNSYSNIEITANENTNATLVIKSSYGDVKNKSKFITMKSDDDDDKDDDKGCCDFTKNYEAKIGSGASKININNNYGKIKFR